MIRLIRLLHKAILMTDTSAQAGDQICVHVEINPTPLDADTS
jgi:hypothetical protein